MNRTAENQFEITLYDQEAIKLLKDYGFADESWGNDACPKFAYRGMGYFLEVWVETIDPQAREFPWQAEFSAKLKIRSLSGLLVFSKSYECDSIKDLISEIKADSPDSELFAE